MPTTDLPRAIREALRTDEIGAADLIHPTLRGPTSRRNPRLLAVVAVAVAVIALAALVTVLRADRTGHRETGSDPLAGVVGYRWRATQVHDAHGTVPVPGSLRAEVGFTRDGYVLGDDTVNALQGNYTPVAHGYAVRDAMSTAVGTTGVDSVRKRIIAAVDNLFFPTSAPGGAQPRLVVQVDLGGDTLTLRHGGTTLTLRRAGPQPDFFAQRPSPTPTRSAATPIHS